MERLEPVFQRTYSPLKKEIIKVPRHAVTKAASSKVAPVNTLVFTNSLSQSKDMRGIVFNNVPVYKNLPVTADNPILRDYMTRLIGTNKALLRKKQSR